MNERSRLTATSDRAACSAGAVKAPRCTRLITSSAVCRGERPAMGLVLAGAEEVQQVGDRGCGSCHVGHRRRVQHGTGSTGVGGSHDAQCLHLFKCPAAGVELDGQSDQLERNCGSEQPDADLQQPGRSEHDAEDGEDRSELASDVGDWQESVTQVQSPVTGCVLDGVTDFVGGDGHASYTGSGVITFREPDRSGPGVVMVSEFAPYGFDPDIVESVRPQDGQCGIAA